MSLESQPRRIGLAALLVWLFACGDDEGAETIVFPTVEEVLRTPDSAFEGLPGYDFEPKYLELGNLRVHYVDEGPEDGVPVVLLHGVPSWSYLYREVVPRLVAGGYRAVVPDLVGFGKSDKPASELDHTYDRHTLWLRGILRALDLRDAVLVAHDFGGPIGLRLAAENQELFRALVVTNTFLPMNERPGFDTAPDLVRRLVEMGPVSFIVQGGTESALPDDVLAAYDAPYPDESFKGGALAVPRIIKTISEAPVPAAVDAAWEALRQWQKPVLTAHSDRDPFLGSLDAVFQAEIPGAAGQPHVVIMDANHFVQEDNAEDFAQAILEFLAANEI